MNEMQVFQNSEFGELGVLEVNGKPYFSATACAKMLGYANPRDAIGRHCNADGVVKHDVIDSMGRTQRAKFITEGNLYRLITHSKLPAAERFEKWVFDEVLPTIRRTGGYSMPGAQPFTMEQMTQFAAAVASQVAIQIVPIIATTVERLLDQRQEQQVRHDQAWAANYHPGPRKKTVVRPPSSNGTLRMETFPPEILNTVNEMMERMVEEQTLNFSEIARYCTRMNCLISSPSVRRYYDKYFNQH